MLNRLGVADVDYNRDTPYPPGGVIERDEEGNPTCLLLAKPNANILYSTLAKGPKLSYSDQLNSTRQFLWELNRFGITSVIDAGGGSQNFPEDYTVMGDLAKRNLLTVRIAYNLFTQRPKHELEDFASWVNMTKPGQGDDFYRMNGAGERLVFSAEDFENFSEPRRRHDRNLIKQFNNPITWDTAIEEACNCPSRRLVILDNATGKAIEHEFEKAIVVFGYLPAASTALSICFLKPE